MEISSLSFCRPKNGFCFLFFHGNSCPLYLNENLLLVFWRDSLQGTDGIKLWLPTQEDNRCLTYKYQTEGVSNAGVQNTSHHQGTGKMAICSTPEQKEKYPTHAEQQLIIYQNFWTVVCFRNTNSICSLLDEQAVFKIQWHRCVDNCLFFHPYLLPNSYYVVCIPVWHKRR